MLCLWVCIGDHRLSLLLSQSVGSQFSRDLLALQLADWNKMQTDSFIQEERLRIFALLAGKPVRLAFVCLYLCFSLSLYASILFIYFSCILLVSGLGNYGLLYKCVLRTGLEALFGSAFVVHAASHSLCSRCSRQI